MSTVDDFIFELGTEELPPKSLHLLSKAFTASIEQQLSQLKLCHQGLHAFATPRRLAVLIQSLEMTQAPQLLEKRGPALKAAFDQSGQPTKAAIGFAASCQTTVADLSRLETEKGTWLLYKAEIPGQSTAQLLPSIIEVALNKLPIAKRMRWGCQLESFIRPIQWILAMHGDQLIPMTLWGKNSGHHTYGHRIHAPLPLTLSHASEYENLLADKGKVIADIDKRRCKIEQGLKQCAKDMNAQVAIPETLLTEVTALVEYPVVLTGRFDEKFLAVPAEALISTMQANQKYFPFTNHQHQLLPRFALVANLVSKDSCAVIAGNEKVIRPRFADAQFFFEQDQKQPLIAFNEPLKRLLFQAELGSVYDKVTRIQALAHYLSKPLQADPANTARAALLCKADLNTLMVQEFPELQGIMGRYYAKLSQETDSVAQAIQEHYYPLNMEQDIPQSREGCCVALADKIDTLVGLFSTGQIPSGDKDPFALRRAAMGIIKILIETKQSIQLIPCLEYSVRQYSHDIHPDIISHIMTFISARYAMFYPSYSTELLDAILSLPNDNPFDIHLRLTTLAQFTHSNALHSLSAANKRVNNLLKKASIDKLPTVDRNALQAEAELSLYDEIQIIKPQLEQHCQQQAYLLALESLSSLKQTVDHFFESVHIMVDNMHLQQQRLGLLQQLRQLFLSVADISKLPAEP